MVLSKTGKLWLGAVQFVIGGAIHRCDPEQATV